MSPSQRTIAIVFTCFISLSISSVIACSPAQDARQLKVEAIQKAGGAAPGAPAPPGAPVAPQGDPKAGQPGAASKEGGKAEEKPGEKSEPARPRRKPTKPADPSELQTRPGEDGRLSFSFKGQDWEDVLEWVADISDMSLQMEEVPPGFLNLTSRGRYTVDQIHDLVNSALINKGFTLVRSGEVLIVSKLDKLDKSLVPRVDPSELDKRGTYEFVKCFFDLKSLIAETTAEELKPMLSPHAKITPLKTTNRLDIVETAGNLRRIRDFLEEEQSERGKENVLREFKLQYVRAGEVLDTLHSVLGLKKPGPQVALTAEQIGQMQQQFMQAAQQAAQQAAAGKAGGKEAREIFLAINKSENSILANAPPDKMAIIEQAVKAMDIPKNKSESLLSNMPKLRSYKLTAVDPVTLVRVLEDLGNLDPQSRLEVDARSKSILAFATPLDHVTIQAMVDKIDGTGRKFEVVQLYVLDAEMVAGSIEFLMRGGEDKNRSRAYNPFYYEFGFGSSRNQQPESNDQLQVEADSERNRLLIRATDVELKEIRQLLTKLGELPEDERGRQTMRVVPMSPSDLQKLIERIQSTWPSVAPNPLRVAPVEVPAETDEEDEADVKPRRRADSKKPRLEPAASDADDRLPVRGVAVSPESSGVRAALANISTREQASPSEFDTLSAQGAVADPSSQDRLPSDADGRRNTRRGDRPPADQQPPAPISITPGPNGLVIASEDVEALDQLERMISELSPTQRTGSKLFYLRNAFCKDVVDVLKDVFREGDSPRQPNPMFDDMYYYYRFGPGSRDQAKERGRLSKRRQLKFISEPMTNTILVLGADAGQLAEIDRLIKVYDEGVRPDSNSVRTTKQLSFRYTTAREVAEVIKDVFRDLLSPIDKAVAKGGAQQQQQEQSRAMYSTTYIFGGDGEKDNARKFKGLLSMGVDDRSNTLIVSAPRDLMGIINEIADELDRAAGESRGVVEVLNLGAASTAVQQILSGVSKPPVTANNKEPAPEANGEKAAAPKAPAGRTEMFVVPN